MKNEQHELRGHNVCRPVRTPSYIFRLVIGNGFSGGHRRGGIIIALRRQLLGGWRSGGNDFGGSGKTKTWRYFFGGIAIRR